MRDIGAPDGRGRAPRSSAAPGPDVDEGAEVTRVLQVSKQEEAIRNYEEFHQLKKGSATLEQVEMSSLGIDGWASAVATLQEESEASSWVVVDDQHVTPLAAAKTVKLPPPAGDAVEAQELLRALLESNGVTSFAHSPRG